jgi:hypothetical protein
LHKEKTRASSHQDDDRAIQLYVSAQASGRLSIGILEIPEEKCSVGGVGTVAPFASHANVDRQRHMLCEGALLAMAEKRFRGGQYLYLLSEWI